jgi:hypothetical protein
VSVIPVPGFPPRQSSKVPSVPLLLLFLGLVSAAAVAAGRIDPPIKCEQHFGDFSDDFSAGFDINRKDCRTPWLKWSPVAHFWRGTPYVALDWGKLHFQAGRPYFWVVQGVND